MLPPSFRKSLDRENVFASNPWLNVFALATLLVLTSPPAAESQPLDEPFNVPLARNPRVLAVVDQDTLHPILSDLLVSTHVETYSGHQDPETFAMVVIDAATVDGNIADHELLNRAIDAGVGILVLDARAEDKTALRRHVGITYNDGEGSLGYFFDLSRDRHAEVFELPLEWPPSVEDMETVPTLPENRLASKQVQKTFNRAPRRATIQPDDPDEVARFNANVLGFLSRTRGAQEGESIDAVGLPDVPPDVKRWTTTIHVQKSLDVGRRQVARFDFEIIIAAYLNNPPQGDQFQYIYVQTDGTLVPGKLAHNSSYHRGWFQRDLRISLSPVGNPQLVLADSVPNNVSGVRNVTDTIGFNIGFTTPRGASGTFNFSQSEQRQISDWRIIETTNATETSWDYFQNHPFDGRQKRCCAGRNRNCAMDFWDKVKSPPTLSKFTMRTNTQSVWRTTSVLDHEVGFNATFEQTLGDYHSKVIHYRCHTSRNVDSRAFVVDLTKIQ